ncbi:hypothetical protein Pint_05337 [Pistacia integerrima]|uniref:Uncharacterized protein n=1 Tax=Pistacia integerrima TaxID=434235 RepID=A0ACC0Z2E3_9ROSI|nr:hypothetical protein Pint_05337 [Pistacia integerrima]
MAEGIVFSIAGKILKELGSLAVQEGELAWGVNDEIRKLNNTINTIKLVLLDEEQHSKMNHVVIDWIQRLKGAFYEADDLLDDFSTELQRREVMTENKLIKEVCIFFSKSNQIAYSIKMAHKIKAIKEKLDAINIDRNFDLKESLEEKRVMNIERETHSFIRAEHVIGRNDDKNKVIQLLLDSNTDENISIISICGFGGLGKTALAQLLYNDEHIINHFQLRMWVYVSNKFNVKIIVEKILKSAAGKKIEGFEMDQLQEYLRNEINGKKYLLVLDDTWNENPNTWNELKNLLMGW